MSALRSKLFGSSGVRGLVNKELTLELATRIGSAVAAYAKQGKVIVARDTRTSGMMLEDAVVSGILAGEAETALAGILPTPALAYSTKRLSAGAGVMITASHNPPQYNGIKIFDHNGTAIGDAEQKGIQRKIARNPSLASWDNICSVEEIAADPLYVELILKKIKLRKNWRVIVDPGCGATYRIAPAIFNSLGCKVTALNAQSDGFFPARSSEPNADSLRPLARVTKAVHAEIAVAFDGDGDRMALIDDKGVFADSDRVLAGYARWVAEKNPNAIIVTNVEASMCVDRMAERAGGRVVRTKVGDVYITEEMRKLNAVFGGESCGAWVHPTFHHCPDGIVSALMVMTALEEQDISLSQFIAKVPQYKIVRKNLACPNEFKFTVVEEMLEKLKMIFPDYANLSTVDGVRLRLREGWILVRASGTEPAVRLTVEGESLRTANRIMRRGREAVMKHIREVSN